MAEKEKENKYEEKLTEELKVLAISGGQGDNASPDQSLEVEGNQFQGAASNEDSGNKGAASNEDSGNQVIKESSVEKRYERQGARPKTSEPKDIKDDESKQGKTVEKENDLEGSVTEKLRGTTIKDEEEDKEDLQPRGEGAISSKHDKEEETYSKADIDPNKLQKLFAFFKRYSREIKNTSPNPKGSIENQKQRTFTTVIAKKELQNLITLLQTDEDTSVITYLTTKRFVIKYNTGKTKADEVHGEKIVLNNHLNDLIEEMWKCNGYQERPLVLLYSFNIPCSLKNHECARLLKEHKTDKYDMVIGYTMKFGHSMVQTEKNFNKSIEYLLEAGIQVKHIPCKKTKKQGVEESTQACATNTMLKSK